MENFAERFADVTLQRRYDDLASRCQWSFNRLFWNENDGCLYDVVNGGPPDASIRPNQVFAVSLPYTMLPDDKAESVVEVVERELLTPVGLRTLARSDRNYRPHYEGGPWERDSAYHQGTVWPWLLGPFVSAYIKVHGNTAETRSHCAALLQPLRSHLREVGLGQISEIFDADPPHLPRGCFAQAWSVAEILKAQFLVSKPAVRKRANPATVAVAATGTTAS
jgi:glycogen debranching enzyme